MLRCLIVDDSPQFLAAVRTLLEREGLSVVGVASTGGEAVRRAVELSPDVILLDVDLGGESGFDVAGRLQRESGTPGVPVILISTHTEDDYAELIAASAVVGFLPKIGLSAGAIRHVLGARGTDRAVNRG